MKGLRRSIAVSPFVVSGGWLTLMVGIVFSAYLLAPSSPAPTSMSYSSPDGEWVAEVTVNGCADRGRLGRGSYVETITLRSTPDGSAKEVYRLDEGECAGIVGRFGLEGLFWTTNSRYFYFASVRRYPLTGETPYPLATLLRVDPLASGDGSAQLLGRQALSPDGTKFATWFNLELQVHDIERGMLFSLPAPDEAAYDTFVAWSPDSTALAYLQTESWGWRTYLPASALVLVDVAGQSQRVLNRTNQIGFIDIAWVSPGEITLVGGTDIGTATKEWRYNLASGELRRAPPPIAVRILFSALFVPFVLIVGRLLRTRGRVYLAQVFSAEDNAVSSANLLLNVGFYLLCTGLLLGNIGLPSSRGSPIEVIQATATRLGNCVILVATLHSLNVLVLAVLGRKPSQP